MQGIQGFGNSLAFDENGNTPTCIVYYAMKNEEIIALAGASKESDAMWEIGVDVKEPFRNEGLATTLVNHLVLSILKKEKGLFRFIAPRLRMLHPRRWHIEAD